MIIVLNSFPVIVAMVPFPMRMPGAAIFKGSFLYMDSRLPIARVAPVNVVAALPIVKPIFPMKEQTGAIGKTVSAMAGAGLIVVVNFPVIRVITLIIAALFVAEKWSFLPFEK